MASHSLQGHPWVPRLLDLPPLLAKRSHFLLGPRQTGKTSLIRHALKDVKVSDLLDTSVYLALSQRPGRWPRNWALGTAWWSSTRSSGFRGS
jgi:hypothetical protein